jgi:hypothetical protein
MNHVVGPDALCGNTQVLPHGLEHETLLPIGQSQPFSATMPKGMDSLQEQDGFWADNLA